MMMQEDGEDQGVNFPDHQGGMAGGHALVMTAQKSEEVRLCGCEDPAKPDHQPLHQICLCVQGGLHHPGSVQRVGNTYYSDEFS